MISFDKWYPPGRVRLVLRPNAISLRPYVRTARHCRHFALDRCRRSDPREPHPRVAGRDHCRFPSRRDVYLIIAHYLTHIAEINAYLAQRQTEAARLQHAIETRFNPVGIGARLLGRRRRESDTR